MKALRKVLIVDDDPVVGKSFQRVLSNKGYAVVTASDGAEALRKIAAEEYDAVFTDIRMPGMDGIAVAERIKGRQPWLPVVIVSGYATADNEARARAIGVSAVLHKPLSPEMIEESARDAMLERDAGAASAAHLGPDAAVAVVPSASLSEAVPAIEPAEHPAIAFLAPMLGLVYALVLPFAGLLALLAVSFWYAGKAVAKHAGGMKTWPRNIALCIAAPLVGLVYVLALPFVGLGMLAWTEFRAVVKPAEVD
jgi:CheY-like chemotaxis protein